MYTLSGSFQQIGSLCRWSLLVIVEVIVWSCGPASPAEEESHTPVMEPPAVEVPMAEAPAFIVTVDREVAVRDYFGWMDSVVAAYDTLLPYLLDEYLLVHANPWLIDTLAHTDYYIRAQRGEFVYDQKRLPVLRAGQTLVVPGLQAAAHLRDRLRRFRIDVNIPEYRLRIFLSDTLLYSFPVRVGRNTRRFLATADREVDLKTVFGKGEIVRVERDPFYVNPCTGERYYSTLRDDGKRTLMPRIPWLEPAIDSIRYGQLIHPTTNPETLGKAYSNGCIGTGEAAAWIIYYHAPVGTVVDMRYDLEVVQPSGDTLRFADIYGWGRKRP